MSRSRQQLGRLGEDMVSRRLVADGHELVARNWRCEIGEIDIVTREGQELVFVEVRTRRGVSYGTPEESITEAKKARLIELGETFAQEHEWEGPWRIDVAAVLFSHSGELQRLTITQDAVEA